MDTTKTMKRGLVASLSLVILCLFVIGCDSGEPSDGPGEEELITRVTLTLTESGGDMVTVVADDPDGDGLDIAIDTLVLITGILYTGTIQFEDGINNVDITDEVAEEDEEHQVFFTFGDGLESLVTLVVTDEDGNGLPVGLEFAAQVTARVATSGTLNVVLSHFDTTPKDGVTQSDESDVDIVFPVRIEAASPI